MQVIALLEGDCAGIGRVAEARAGGSSNSGMYASYGHFRGSNNADGDVRSFLASFWILKNSALKRSAEKMGMRQYSLHPLRAAIWYKF